MLFAVIVDDPAATGHEDFAKYRDARQAMLAGLKTRGVLYFEGTLGEGGSLMILDAESTNHVLEIIQRDPAVALPSSRVAIRPLVVNVIADWDQVRERAVAPLAAVRR